jgi:hemoglobin
MTSNSPAQISFRLKVMRIMALLLAFVFVIGSADQSEAKRRRRRHRRSKPKRAVINEPDLYERIGGQKGIAELVDDWVRSAMADGRLSGSFGKVTEKPAEMNKFRKDLNDQLCEITDGPCGNRAAAKKPAQAILLPDSKFVVFADHLVRSMDRQKVREREKNELLGRLGELHDSAVEPEDDES